jgi:hypothetical protein
VDDAQLVPGRKLQELRNRRAGDRAADLDDEAAHVR